MTPAYQLEALAAVGRDLDRLGHAEQQRVARRIDALPENPRPSGVQAITGYPGYFRLRVGDYRIVYTIDDTARLVTIVIVGHRRDVYERMMRRL